MAGPVETLLAVGRALDLPETEVALQLRQCSNMQVGQFPDYATRWSCHVEDVLNFQDEGGTAEWEDGTMAVVQSN